MTSSLLEEVRHLSSGRDGFLLAFYSGAMGSATAYELTRKGKSVLLLEQHADGRQGRCVLQRVSTAPFLGFFLLGSSHMLVVWQLSW
jgi:hypothetical protein